MALITIRLSSLRFSFYGQHTPSSLTSTSRGNAWTILKGNDLRQQHMFNGHRCLSTRTKADRKKQKIQADLPPSTDVRHDLIGPPDPISNIPPIKYFIPANETATEENFRLQRKEVVEWNQKFWSVHNTKYFKEKDSFVKEKKSSKKKSLSPEEMSIFYRKFLEENRQSHLEYNREWYKKNLGLLWPAIKVTAIRLKRRLSG